jgi:small-conductance mechanosensitive channel
VHELLIAAARASDGIIATPEPFVFQTSLDDFYVSYQINAHTKEPKRMAAIYSDLHQNIQDRFFDAGVEIMSPHYGSLRDGNEVAIPPDKRPASYRAPSFRVRRTDGGGETAP